jgi:hypothetical protein
VSADGTLHTATIGRNRLMRDDLQHLSERVRKVLMVSWFSQSAALGVVRLLFWGSVLASLASFFTDRHLHSLLRAHWKLMLTSVALVLLWRIPWEGGFFHGTEYEDSYVYTVAARQMAAHFRIEPTGATLPYSINVCAVGNLIGCKQADNFPEHLIGYPYTLSVLSSIYGYRPSIGSIANVVCACFADMLIFLLCMVIARDVVAAGSAALIFAITPIFAVWGLETSAEPASNGCMTLVLWFCLRFVFAEPERRSRWGAIVAWCAFTATLLFSLTVKRENILLAILLPLVVLLVHFLNGGSYRSLLQRSWWVMLTAALGLMLSLHMKIFQTMSSETALLNRFPISTAELIRLLPVFLRSFCITQWYGSAVVLVLVGVVVAWRRRALELFPFFLFASYVLLYAFHIRSYYEMQSGSTDSRTALRFSMSLMSMWSLLAGLGAASVFGWARRTRAWKTHRISVVWAASCGLAVVLGASYYATTSFRDDVVEDEFRMRIEPSLTAARIAARDHTKENYILTLEPLILQMYAEPEVAVLSLDDLDDTVMKEIRFSEGNAGVLYVDEEIHRSREDAERYKSQLEYLNQFQRANLTSNEAFSVARICTVSSGHALSGKKLEMLAPNTKRRRIILQSFQDERGVLLAQAHQ